MLCCEYPKLQSVERLSSTLIPPHTEVQLTRNVAYRHKICDVSRTGSEEVQQIRMAVEQARQQRNLLASSCTAAERQALVFASAEPLRVSLAKNVGQGKASQPLNGHNRLPSFVISLGLTTRSASVIYLRK